MYKRILVALDGSQIAEASLPVAVELGQKLGAEIILIQVCEIFALMKKDKAAEEKTLKENAIEYLDCLVCKLEPQGVRIGSVVLSGKPSMEICNYAKNNQVDLIIMTTHGLGGFTGWAVGSVSEKVVRHAAMPVLLLRSKEALSDSLF